MKTLLKFLLFALCPVWAAAQYPGNANDWIDYSKTYYKLKVEEDGLYRVTADELISAGVPAAELTGAAIQLFRNGEEVPVYVSTNGVLSGSAFIEFYGQKNDGIADTPLYQDAFYQPSTHKSLFSDVSTYFLTLSPGTTNLRISDIANDIANPPAAEEYFMATNSIGFDDARLNGFPHFIGNASLFDSNFAEGEGFYSPRYQRTNEIPVPTPNVVSSVNEDVSLSVKFTYSRYIAPTTHSLNFTLGSSATGNLTYNGGYGLQEFNSTYAPSVLTNGTTPLEFQVANSNSRRYHISDITVTYPRGFNFSGETLANITVNQPGSKYFEVVMGGSSSAIIYDWSANERIEAANATEIKFRTSTSSAGNNLLVATETNSLTQPITSTVFTDYSTTPSDLIVVYHPALETAVGGENQVDRYINYRQSAAGGGYSVTKVNIFDAYDQFAYGIEYHSAALKNLFLELNELGVEPNHVFILGKGHEYSELHSASPQLETMLVPAYGLPGSDNLYVSDYHDTLIRSFIGRLAAKSASDVKNYVDKLVEYEGFQADTSDPAQTKDKIWMKEALHLGGGANSSQQNLFRSYLNSFKVILEDDYYGGKVTSVFKTSTDPIQIAESVVIDSLIDRGISLVTFFGHAAANVFEFNLRDPANYENQGRYPVIVTNGCFVGNLFNTQNTLSEDFVLEPTKGSIAFMGPIQFGIAQGMRSYSEFFYRNTSIDHYDKTIGENIIRAINQSTNNGATTSRVAIFTSQQMIYHGDPLIRLNPHPKPDYLIEVDDFQLNPAVVTADDETFEVKLNITNIGRALDEQVDVSLTRVYPDGTEVVFTETIGPVLHSEEVVFELETDAIAASGLNSFRVEIDPSSSLDEITRSNNVLEEISTSIVSNTVTPAFPYDYGITNDDNLELKASSVQFYETEQTFLFEIDTTSLFNSPFKQSTSVLSLGGIVKWAPPVSWEDERVYYWRTKIDEPDAIWRESSFVHLDAYNSGWNQSHYYQLLDNRFNSLKIDENRDFQFADNNRNITVRTSIFPTIPYNQMSYFLDGDLKFKYTCPVEIAIAVFDENSGIPWENLPQGGRMGEYESVSCRNAPMDAFLYNLDTEADRLKMMNMLDQVPDGKYILMFSQLPPNPTAYNWAGDAGTTLFDKLEDPAYGATGIRNLPDSAAYMLFTRKNDPSFTPIERVGVDNTTIIDEVITLNGVWSFGNMSAPEIGPASAWGSFEWEWDNSLDGDPTGDDISVSILGVSADGSATILFDDITTNSVDLSGVNASTYPFIRLQVDVLDPVNFTSAQLLNWRVIYDKVPELAIANLRITGNEESNVYPRGKNLTFSYDIENISDLDMTPVLVNYENTYGNRDRVILDERYAALPAGESISVDYEFDTDCTCAYGNNSLLIDVNPNDDQLEQYHFNNVALLQYEVLKDDANPYLDVTFDGIHIIDGDFVTEQPSILITLTDENEYLALDRPEDFKILVQEPGVDTLTTYTALDNPDVLQFFPANEGGLAEVNKAVIEFTPTFIVGEHTMIVQGKDRSENNAGVNDYRVSFEVTGEDIITQVINYPNPFSSRTEFIANIVGDAPDQVLIQIFSQNGRVIKEIQSTPDQISVSDGNNFYKLAEWNGEDDFGDPVGNGLYFYKVTLKRNGEVIQPAEDERYNEYFYNGLGKLYIVR